MSLSVGGHCYEAYAPFTGELPLCAVGVDHLLLSDSTSTILSSGKRHVLQQPKLSPRTRTLCGCAQGLPVQPFSGAVGTYPILLF